MTVVLKSRKGHLNVPQHGGGQHLVRQGKHVGLGLPLLMQPHCHVQSLTFTVSSHLNHLPKAPPPNHQHMNLEIKFPTDRFNAHIYSVAICNRK